MRFQVIVDFPPGLVTAAKQIWQIEEDQARLEYRVDAVDVEMVVAADGRIHVTEHQQITVEAGILDEGYRDFNLLFVERLTLQELREGDQLFQLVTGALCAYCYTELQLPRQPDWVYYNETAGEVQFHEAAAGLARFNWAMPGLVRGESTTLTLAYEVEGAFTVEADGHLLTWTAVPAQENVPDKTSLRLQLPANLGWEDVQIEGAAVSRVEGRLLIGVEEGRLRLNRQLFSGIQAEVRFPVDCRTGLPVKYIIWDSFPPHRKEDLLILERGYWYGKEIEFPIFDEHFTGLGPECLKAEIWLFSFDGRIAARRELRAERSSRQFVDAGTPEAPRDAGPSEEPTDAGVVDVNFIGPAGP
jgi:hypothetical protein